MRPRCARILAAPGRLITFDSGVGIRSDRMNNEDRYPLSVKNILGRRSGLVSSLRCQFENGNSKKFVSIFFQSKLGNCNFPSKVFWIFVKSGFLSSSAGFHGISNQF